jgi:hypothetical protein
MAGATHISAKQPAAEFDLSVPEDALAIAERFHGEWCNGGFTQLFSNWEKADILLLPAALTMLGAAEASAIVAAAIGELQASADWRKAASAALRSKTDALGDKLWALDRRFDPHEGVLWKRIEIYEAALNNADDSDEVK